uniref:Cornichon family member 4 n=1 Tax=Sus scrofa TaxID=9823 RepID=A0A8D1PHS3_PIG
MEAVVFVFSLLDCCALIFLSVYFIITLSDLECDYINARSCCSKLNKWVLPELVGHTIVTVLMLISLHWFIFLLNLPVATWNIYRFIMVPSGNMGVFDPTEIHNRGQLKSHMKEAMIKLGFHLLCFFMYLYRATPVAFRNCRLGVESELQLLAYTTASATATWDLSHVCNLHCILWQHRILNPLSEARDRTHILMDTSQLGSFKLIISEGEEDITWNQVPEPDLIT